MRAIVAHAIGAPEDLKIDQMPDPVPGPGEVLVDMKATAVNFPDLAGDRGEVPDHPAASLRARQGGRRHRRSTSAKAWTVSSVGDRVMVQVEWGTYAEKLVLPADHCFPMPDGMSFEEAAAMGIAYQTAHFALVARAGVKAGDRVLVTAATGSVGIAALQLARAFGCTVLAGVTTMSKADVARENGADHIVDLTVENLRDSIRGQVKEACGALDVVLESVGGEVFDGAVRALDFEGRAVIVGFTGGEIASFRTNYALLKVISVTGVNWAAYRDRDPEWVQRVQRELFDLHGEGRIAIPVQAVLPMADYVEAFDVIRGRQVRGKVILRMD